MPLPDTDFALWLMAHPDLWEWRFIVSQENSILKANDKKIIYDESGKGFIYYLFLTANNQLLKWALTYAGGLGKEVELVTDFDTENTTSGVANAITGYRLLKFDSVNNIFTFEWGPGVQGWPGVPFQNVNIFELRNEESSDITYNLIATLLIIKEEKKKS